jgi:pyrroline-5-carboxylate reductase
MSSHILIIGCGKMGGAIAKRLLAEQATLTIVDHHENALSSQNIVFYTNVSELPDSYAPDVIILAVKPQAMAMALSTCKFENCIYISIAAGLSLDFLAKHLPQNAAIIRTMPNTPSAIGAGVTVALENQYTKPTQKDIVQSIFSCLGSFHWIENEDDFHAVTALSGSGPAYLFYFAECLTNAGIKLGLSPEFSVILAQDMLYGSACLLKQDLAPPEVLRHNVTSKAGTTEAAVDVLKNDQIFEKIIADALTAAQQRSIQLSEIEKND